MRIERYPTEQDMITIQTSLCTAFSPSTKYLIPCTVDSWIRLSIFCLHNPSPLTWRYFLKFFKFIVSLSNYISRWYLLHGPRHTEIISEALQTLKIHHGVPGLWHSTLITNQIINFRRINNPWLSRHLCFNVLKMAHGFETNCPNINKDVIV